MSIISGFNKVKNYVKTTEGYKLLSRWTSSDTVDVGGKTLTEVVNELGTASKKDVAASGNASTTQVVMGNDTRLTDARKASDVSAWAKASTKPTYTASEVGLGNVGNFKAVSTVASQELTDTEKANARSNINAQVAGSYASASHTHDDRYYTETEIDTKLNGKANSSHSHGNGDITSLDASKITSGTIDLARLPQGALDRLIKVADDTARFKLTTKDVQLGDSVKVTSTKKMYIVIDETKLSSEDGYEPYTADSATSVPWSGVTGKPSTYTPSSHTHTKSQITDFPTSMPASDVSDWAKASSKPSYSKSEVGLGNVDNTADSAKSVKYATSAGSASSASKSTSVVDYGSTTRTIQIGYGGDGISGDKIKYIAGYTSGNGSDVNAKIKDVSKDALKSWLGLGSLAYSSATIPTIPSSLPANGGNSTTVNGHTINADVPSGAKFTDTDTWRPLGTTADTACAGNDSRLSNARPANGGTADNSNHVYSIDGSGTKRAMTMNWVGKDGQPSWLWGGVDGANMYVYNPNNFNVNYANSAGSAPANGGTATYANYVYATSHQGSWYQNSQWDGTYFQTNYKNGNNVLPMKVGYAGYADSAGSASSVAWSNVSGRPSSMPASDVYSWAKASSKPSYTASEVGAAAANHSHSNYLTGINKSMVVNALGYTPPTTDTNTWRGIQNNLTSTSTTDSLSAYQGKLLNDKITTINSNLTNDLVNSKSLAIGSNIIISKILSAGTYLIIGEAQLVNTAGGRYDLYVYGNGMTLADTFPGNYAYPCACVTSILSFAEQKTIQLQVWQTTTSTLNNARLLTIRLK